MQNFQLAGDCPLPTKSGNLVIALRHMDFRMGPVRDLGW
jgi:hypothetical protein